MIRKVHIQHYRGIENAEFSLEPLTILVGPNGSGKTSILDALNPGRPIIAADYSRHLREETPPEIRVETKGGWVVMRQGGNVRNFQVKPTGVKTYRCQLLRMSLDALRASNLVASASVLETSGANLTNVFDTLTRQQQQELSETYCRLIHSFSDVDTLPAEQGHKRLRFRDRWNSEMWYAPEEVSDGSMLVLAFLLLQYQNPSPDLLAIEEPERGLHPYLLGELIKLFRQLATGALGKRIQIIAATHSAELIEFAKPEEVRFVTRNPKDGKVVVTEAQTSTEEWKKGFEEYGYSLGSVWLSGNLGGVPGK